MIESVSESITVSSDAIKKKSIRVLHIDSDPSFLKVAKQILEMKDELEVETVCSVEEAHRKMKERNYDVIVSDYKLQGEDCLQLLKELRSNGYHIPFIVFADRRREEIAIEALNLGADNYVNKHDDPEKAYTELIHDIHNSVRISKAEEILRKSEETLKLALKASGAGVWNYDFSEKRMTWSNELYALYGLEPGSLESSGKNWLSCAHPDDRDRINKSVAHIIKSRRYLFNEYRVVLPDGTIHYLSDKGRAFYDGNGMPLRMTGISIDVTEDKKREDESRRLASIVESSDDAIIGKSLDGTIVSWNTGAQKIYGYTSEEVVGKPISILIPPELHEEMAIILKKIREGENVDHCETIRVTKDQKRIWVSLSVSPIRDASGIVTGASTIARDITKRKETERLIVESQQRFAALFTGNPEATVYADQDFHIIDVNPPFESLFGYPLNEVKGKKINDVILPEELLDEAEMLEKKAAEGYVSHDTIRKRRDGTLVSVSVSASRVFIQNRLAGYISVYKDISEQVNSHKKLSLMNEKLRVVGGLTRHDIRNKMTAIVGNAYLAKKEAVGNDKTLHYLKEIEKAVQQSVRLFEFAKIYEMLGVEELTYIDVGKAFSDAASLIADLKGVALIDDCHGLTVLADSLLQQLFYNLIDNSLKYGERTRRITIRYERSGRGNLELIYEDDGVGIPASQKTKLFGEGYTTGGSTGYGLYLIRKMTETYGSTIREVGESGKGARFVIQIPKRNASGSESYRIAQ